MDMADPSGYPVPDSPSKTGLMILLICLALAGVVLVIDDLLPLGVAGGVPYVAVVLAAQWSPRRRLVYEMAILTTILTGAGFLLSPPGGELWKVALNRLLAIGAIWATAVVAFRRGRAEDHIRAALAEKEVLLKEIHHRVKNNLQIVGGLLQLQAARMVDTKLASALEESRTRVIAMATLHENLYRSEDLANIDA